MQRKRLNRLRRAAHVLPLIFKSLQTFVASGMTELAVATFIKQKLKEHGMHGHSFRIIVASGRRSALPHGHASRKKIRRGELVVLDYGALLDGYCSDYTRTLVVGNKPSKRQKFLLRVVRAAQTAALKLVRVGVSCYTVDAAARDYLKKHDLHHYFIHTTGHGIGTKVHEAPKISPKNRRRLRLNEVITIEPGVYIKGYGGVRIEDMVLVKKDGYELLTKAD
ncbi:MAG: M24 family metallopeptidase [Candidatus Margulisiibacteriota bacterium]